MPTVRHLLAHQSGVRHTSDADDRNIRSPAERLSSVIHHFGGDPLRFTPSRKVLTSSWGYTLLGCIMEGASGQAYMDYIRQNIFSVAGMKATHQDKPTFAARGFSPGYRHRFIFRLAPSEIVDTRFKTPAAGLISSVADLAKFFRALFDGRLLEEKSLVELFTAQRTENGKKTDRTLGWNISSESGFGSAYYRTGSMEGTTAFLYVIPSRKYAIAILANLERSVRKVASMTGELNEILLPSSQPKR